jgi:branched-chain amino acid transport system substrate-binding protein
VKTNRREKRPGSALELLAVTVTVALLAACGGVSSASPASTTSQGRPISRCGLGTGQKATGDPITLGAVVTKQPGTDFTPTTGIAQAYFNCVNDNGGINGRPIRYIVYQEQTQPPQVAALARRLVEQDRVLALVGGQSLTDCPVNHHYYEQMNFNVILAGVPFDCFSTPNISGVNMGPYYSTLGATQYLIRQGVKALATAGANVPGGEHDVSGVQSLARQNNIPFKGTFLVNVPVTDAATAARNVVQAAGDGGGVVISFTTAEGLKILEAAEQLGLVDRVKWAWDTPGNDTSVVQALGPAWNGKLGVNAELNLVDSTGPDNLLYQQITSQYAPDIPLGSFGQMGFLSAAIITRTLLQLPPAQLTQAGVNAAIRRIKDFKTDMYCRPWYFGNLSAHVPVNVDWTVVPESHVFVQREGCFNIAAMPIDPLAQIRLAERRQGLNA